MTLTSEEIRNSSLTLPSNITPLLAEEIGLHVGDGSMNFYEGKGLYQLRGHLVDDREHYEERIAFLYRELFNLKIRLREMPSTGVFGFQVWSSELVVYKSKTLGLALGKKTHIHIPQSIVDDQALAKAFLRGLFDTDGSIYIENKRDKPYPRASITCVSRPLQEQIVAMLTKLGFRWSCYLHQRKEPTWNDVYTITVRGHEMVERWFFEISPQNPKHRKRFLNCK